MSEPLLPSTNDQAARVRVGSRGSRNSYLLTRLRTNFDNIRYNSKGLRYKNNRFASITENNNFEKVHSIWNLRLI